MQVSDDRFQAESGWNCSAAYLRCFIHVYFFKTYSKSIGWMVQLPNLEDEEFKFWVK